MQPSPEHRQKKTQDTQCQTNPEQSEVNAVSTQTQPGENPFTAQNCALFTALVLFGYGQSVVTRGTSLFMYFYKMIFRSQVKEKQ